MKPQSKSRPASPRALRAATLRIEGGLLFAPDSLQFDPTAPYTYCRICGTVFQQEQDRTATSTYDLIDRMEVRKAWSHNHAKSHPQHHHDLLVSSGMWCFPEAVEKLASFGILPVGAGVLNREVRHALELAPSIPTDDAEGSR